MASRSDRIIRHSPPRSAGTTMERRELFSSGRREALPRCTWPFTGPRWSWRHSSPSGCVDRNLRAGAADSGVAHTSEARVPVPQGVTGPVDEVVHVTAPKHDPRPTDVTVARARIAGRRG